jgi:SnoaL-like domain
MGVTTDTELRERIARLEDRAEIRECMMRYARGMDRRDRELLRSAYHDGAVDDHVGFIGEVDDFIDWAFAYHSTQTRYQHYLLNHTVELNGVEAHAETYYLFVGTDREPANHVTVSGGRYVDRLCRRVERGVNVVDHRGGDRDDGRLHEGRQARQDGSLL